jgi:hypothetical protein
MGVKEVRRTRNFARAKAQQELEGRNLANDDSEYWGRVIPVDLKDRAVNEVVEEENGTWYKETQADENI